MPILEIFFRTFAVGNLINNSLKLNVMKTFEEFENALVNGESVYVANGKGLVVNFYPCSRSGVCGLITACVEFSVLLDDETFHNSSSVVSSMEAYQTYESLSNMA